MTRRRGTTDAPPPSAAPLTPGTTESPDRQAAEAQVASPGSEATAVTASGDLRGLDAAILKFLRRSPNKAVDLGPLAQEIGADPGASYWPPKDRCRPHAARGLSVR